MKRCSRQKWLVKSQQAKVNASLNFPLTPVRERPQRRRRPRRKHSEQRKERSAVSLSNNVEDASGASRTHGDLRMSQAGDKHP